MINDGTCPILAHVKGHLGLIKSLQDHASLLQALAERLLRDLTLLFSIVAMTFGHSYSQWDRFCSLVHQTDASGITSV